MLNKDQIINDIEGVYEEFSSGIGNKEFIDLESVKEHFEDVMCTMSVIIDNIEEFEK